MTETNTAPEGAFSFGLDVDVYKKTTVDLTSEVPLASMELAVNQIRIVDDASYENGVALMNRVAAVEKKRRSRWDRIKKPLNALRASILEAEHETVDPWQKLKDAINKKLEEYALAQKRAKAEADRELNRVAQQQKRSLADEAQDLISQGYVKEGLQKQAQANMTVAPTLPAAIPKVEGARVTDGFTGSCTDLIALMKEIVEGRFPLMHEVRGVERPLIMVDQVVVNALVSRLGDGLKVPGITVTDSVRIGSKKL